MKPDVRIAVVGTGAIAQVAHLPVLKKMRGVHVVAVAPGGPAAGRFTPGDVVVEQLYPVRRAIKSQSDWQQATTRRDARGYITFLVFNVVTRSTRVETVRVGGH